MTNSYENFQPNLFISVGETEAFYTLRETYLHFSSCWTGGRQHVSTKVLSYHIQNLSQSLDKAVCKAEAYAKNSGIRFIHPQGSKEEILREIKRQSAEQIEEEQRGKDAASHEADITRRDMLLEKLASGVYPVGRYADMPLCDAPISYIDWILNESFEKDSIMQDIQDAVKHYCSHLALPVCDANSFAGDIKQRLTFNATVVSVIEYEGYDWNGFPELKFIHKFCTDMNVCLVCFSNAFKREVGDRVTFKATVKEHTVYENQAQTIIQRVKFIEEVK